MFLSDMGILSVSVVSFRYTISGIVHVNTPTLCGACRGTTGNPVFSWPKSCHVDESAEPEYYGSR